VQQAAREGGGDAAVNHAFKAKMRKYDDSCEAEGLSRDLINLERYTFHADVVFRHVTFKIYIFIVTTISCAVEHSHSNRYKVIAVSTCALHVVQCSEQPPRTILPYCSINNNKNICEYSSRRAIVGPLVGYGVTL
jgi:hypothetical protein